MARFLADLQLIRRAAQFALLMTLITVPMHSQSNSENLSTDRLSQSDQESKQPVPIVAGSVPSSAASPEETRQAQIEADTKKLYKLASELRAEVARTYKESLSLNVIKKAEEVEKLAKTLKVEMSKNPSL